MSKEFIREQHGQALELIEDIAKEILHRVEMRRYTLSLFDRVKLLESNNDLPNLSLHRVKLELNVSSEKELETLNTLCNHLQEVFKQETILFNLIKDTAKVK